MSITRLLAILSRTNPELSGSDIADGLWLLRYQMPMPPAEGMGEKGAEEEPLDATETATDEIPVDNHPLPQEDVPPEPDPASVPPGENKTVSEDALTQRSESQAPLHTPTQQQESLSNRGKTTSIIRIHGPNPLPHAGEIAKALRPLRRRVDSRRHVRLDEQATAEYSARERLFFPVFRPTRSRWLSLDLVIDRDGGGLLWHDTINEFRKLLIRQGAFRNLRIWRCFSDRPGDAILLFAGSRSAIPRHPKELCDPEGRNVILILSDCVGRAWHDGRFARAIASWGTFGPTAIVHMLPTTLWEHTAVGREQSLWLRSRSMVPKASEFDRTPVDLSDDEDDDLPTPDHAAVTPILALGAAHMNSWARLMLGHREVQVFGKALRLHRTTTTVPSTNDSLSYPTPSSAEQRLQRFLGTSSPIAQRLAHFAAAAPITLPILRLVREALVPEAEQSHLAEVLLGGLLYRQSPVTVTDPDQILFEFHEGVREKLLARVPKSRAVEVFRRVSEHLDARRDRQREMLVALGLPSSDVAPQFVESRAFAQIRATLLRGMGYSQLAEQLERQPFPNEQIVIGVTTIRVALENVFRLPVDAVAISRGRMLRYDQASPKDSLHGQVQALVGFGPDEAAYIGVPLEMGGVRVTQSGGLPARYLLHTAIIDDIGGQPTREQDLETALRTIFAETKSQGWNSVAIPLMGTRVGGVSLEAGTKTYLREALAYARKNTTSLVITFTFVLQSGYDLARRILNDIRSDGVADIEPSKPPDRKSIDWTQQERSISSLNGLPTLIIGVGGTGLKVLQRVKERLIETYYGAVPPNITLLEFDTALQAPSDNFCGVQLTQELQMGAISEMSLVQTNALFTMDEAMHEARRGERRWDWMEVDKLGRVLTPAQRIIIDGAGAFRPVGRTAFFLNYGAVEQKLLQAMQQVLNQQPEGDIGNALDGVANANADQARTRRNVFIVSSFAGGTGSGGFIDIAAMIRSLRDTNPAFVNIQLIGIITLSSFFANQNDDIGRRVPNTYAGLRELDRLMVAHRRNTPYRFTGGHNRPVTIDNALFDLCYLVDTTDTDGIPAGPNPDLGALPAIVDVIVAHTDLRLGLRLTAANVNVTANYARPMNANPRQYARQSVRLFSSLNSHTIIFPREDVARSLSYRFLLEFIDTHLVARNQQGQLLEPTDPAPINDVLTSLGDANPSNDLRQKVGLEVSGDPMDMGIFVRSLLNKQYARYDTEARSVMEWLVEDGEERLVALDTIQKSITQTTTPPADARDMRAYLRKVESWLDTNLGELVDDNNPFGDRSGGLWARVTSNLVRKQRSQLEAYVQKLVLRLLNQREEQPIGNERTSLLRANRLGYTLGILRKLKAATRNFIRQTEISFGDAQSNLLQLRRDLEDWKARVAQFRGGWFAGNPGQGYLNKLKEVAEAERLRLLRNLVVAMATEFGGDIAESGRPQSVLDSAITELQTWDKGFARVREVIAQAQTLHENQRRQKYAIRNRSYITDTNRFPQAATVEEGLYQRYRPIVWRTLLGPDPMGADGPALFWAEVGNSYFDYKIVSKHKNFRLHPHQQPTNHPLFAEASGAEEIAQRWMEGGFRLMAEQVRNDKAARVAAYIADVKLYRDQADLINRSLTPNSRALALLQGMAPAVNQQEHYLAVDDTSDDQRVGQFYQYFRTPAWQQMNHSFLQAASEVACSYVMLYHGLELDHFQGFQESERSYRAMEITQGALHIFPEERYAAEYEAQIAKLNRPDWPKDVRLHPEVVAGLGKPQRVRSFAFALAAGVIQDSANGFNDNTYRLPHHGTQGEPIILTNTAYINNYALMMPNDKVASRLLQAFQAYTLLGHGIDAGRFPIDYGKIDTETDDWLKEARDQAQRDAVVDKMLAPLFQSESKDPRFRDLGMILVLQLSVSVQGGSSVYSN